MRKLVVINTGNGSIKYGFSDVIGTIYDNQGNYLLYDKRVSLPPQKSLDDFYRELQDDCQRLKYQKQRAISGKAYKTDIATTLNNIRKKKKELIEKVNEWLGSDEFNPLEKLLRDYTNREDEIWIILQTKDNLLRRNPLHRWSFVEDRPLAEIALGGLGSKFIPRSRNLSSKSRILAILGDDKGIDYEPDMQELRRFSNVEYPQFLKYPSRLQLFETLNNNNCSIVFFAGHSNSNDEGSDGEIAISSEYSLSISELEEPFNKLISKGLKLAIFNSCNGIGLASRLANLNIPQVIVMREKVADEVAQKFLKYFLTEFNKHQSFYLAMRETRRQLKALEDKYPLASWFPIMYQDPIVALGMLKQPPPNLYYKLIDYVKRDWCEEANQETLKIIKKTMYEDENEFLRLNDLGSLPTQCLREIDQHWVKNSRGKFGFSKQKRIANSIDLKPNDYDYQKYLEFCKRVGWSVKSEQIEKDNQREAHYPLILPDNAGIINFYKFMSKLMDIDFNKSS